MLSTIVALDVGASSLKAVESNNPFSRHPTAIRAGLVELEEGTIVNGDVADEFALAHSIKELWRIAGFKSNRVVVSFDGQKSLLRPMTLPLLPLDLLRQSLPLNAAGDLPMPSENYVLDFVPIAKSKDRGNVDGFLVAMDVDTANSLSTALMKANLSVLRIDSAAFAIARTFQPFYDGSPTAIVSIGSRTTNVVIVNGHGVARFIRIIPEGGHDVTKCLMDTMNIDHKSALELKKSIGLMGIERNNDMTDMEYARLSQASELIRSQTKSIILRIRNSIQYYMESDDGIKVEKIIVTGGVAGMKGMVESVSMATGIESDQSFMKSRMNSVKLNIHDEAQSKLVMDRYDGFTTAFGLLLGPRP